MSIPSYPLKFIKIRDEDNNLIIWNDILYIAAVSLIISVPFLFFQEANFFHKDGFVDRVGDFASVLTGFYVAGLVAVATFAEQRNGIDKTIEVGRVKFSHDPDDEPDFLTRRQYVCSMFGYLAFLSLAITLVAIIVVIVAEALSPLHDLAFTFGGRGFIIEKDFLRGAGVVACSIPVASLTVTTLHGLYYLIDRLYAVSPTLLPDKDGDEGGN